MSCPPRFSTPRTPERATLGGQVAAVAEKLRHPLLDWQRHVVDVALELDAETGRLAYSEVVVSVPRQQGKTTLLLAVRVHRAVSRFFGMRQYLSHTAQTRTAARVKLVDEHDPLLRRSAFAGAYRLRLSKGEEAILWRNGSIDALTATEESSGHGPVLDVGVLDEAWTQTDARLEQAYRPAMLTRGQPQLWIVSTAGTVDRSVYLKAKVDAGRERAIEAATQGTAYFEWSAHPDAERGSPATWAAAMPAWDVTIAPATVAGDYASMDSDEFARSHLNVWPEAPRGGVFEQGMWEAAAAGVESLASPCLAFDVNPERSASAIVAAFEANERPMVEVVEHRGGTGWVVPRLVELVGRHEPRLIVCDGASPAGSLLTDALAADLDVRVVNATESAQACGVFYDAVVSGELRHTNHESLNAAVAGADTRKVRDTWLWSRSSSLVDISPLVGASLALWAHRQVAPDDLEPLAAWT